MQKTKLKAKKIKEIVLEFSKTYNTSLFGRKFDALLEEVDSKQVIIEFLKLYSNDKQLQRATKVASRWIAIDNWLEKYEKEVLNKEVTLFDV